MENETGFGSDYYIISQIENVEKIAKQKGLDLYSTPMIIGFDVQGPVVKLTDASFEPWSQIKSAILDFNRNKSIEKAIISGWDLKSLENFRDTNLGDLPISIIGELGSIINYENHIYEINPMKDTFEFYNMELDIFKKAAEKGLKIAIQGNASKNVNCFYFEGDGIERGDIRNHFLVKDTDITTNDIYQSIITSPFNTDNFEYNNNKDKICFESTIENIEIIDYVLRQVYTLQSVRLAEENENKISIRRDNDDNINFTIDDMVTFSKEAIPDSWEIEPNSDYCIDVIHKNNGYRPTKETAAYELGKLRFGEQSFIITNIGDKKGDVLTGPNTIFFAQIGSPAENYCIDENLPYIPVVNAIDYFHIMAQITNTTIKNRILSEIPQIQPIYV
ncbi:MAG: hypothetical protein GQ477_02055 [Nanohaloarchaea archaeon]|nr:hypothetical protein [Candidatus Nanohaloarchaea archaeon]